ncbi:hypothetical protein [Leucobacter komagatae]|uniref:Uncharacterized protein n=1 Tax=Leucobacter komagatae TaxID=55969 RepID=A0A0D0IK80_9MICO|nr:hypothetical protein [Leucobacter komagatae]KIP51482.1 hypothetical protein SD72_15115 [Leucobacter komagatae]
MTMRFNIAYSGQDEIRTFGTKPRLAADGTGRTDTMFEFLDQDFRLSRFFLGKDGLGRPVDFVIIRVKTRQLLQGAIALGLPAPLWLMRVNREFEAGWIISRRVQDLKRDKTVAEGGNPSAEDAAEDVLRRRLSELLGGDCVETFVNPIKGQKKLVMANLREGWPHVNEFLLWLEKPPSAVDLRREGQKFEKELQRVYGRDGAKTAPEAKRYP